MNFWEYVANFISWLFVPSADYFTIRVMALNDAVNRKLGGVSYLFGQISAFWGSMDSVQSSELIFTIPDNFLFSGYRGFSLDFLQTARPYLSMISAVLTAAVCIYTAIACYHKLRSLFTEGGTAA